MKKKILFSKLLKNHSDTTRKLKVDKKNIFHKNSSIYFINIDFNCLKFNKNNAQFFDDGVSTLDYIPSVVVDENGEKIDLNAVKIFFYCCSFIDEVPKFDLIEFFYRCDFKNTPKTPCNVLLKKCKFKIINNSFKNIEGGEIEELSLLGKYWNKKYYVNKQYKNNSRKTKIFSLIIKNTVFGENFKLHNCEIEHTIIQDTDFEKHADFFKTIFHQGVIQKGQNNTSLSPIPISFKAINFKGLALFGDTEFKQKVTFQYVTFESFSHFRGSMFYKGLDLDYSNIQKEMNFFGVKKLDSKDSKKNTSQETYRVIKHNFEKIGNKIEANQYHALELSKNGDNLRKNILSNKNLWSSLQRGIVSCIHYTSSKYSSSWVRALLWIFIVGLTTNYYLCGSENIKLDTVFQYMSILTKTDDFHSNNIVFLLNKISLGYLYYQFVISIKRDTRK